MNSYSSFFFFLIILLAFSFCFSLRSRSLTLDKRDSISFVLCDTGFVRLVVAASLDIIADTGRLLVPIVL